MRAETAWPAGAGAVLRAHPDALKAISSIESEITTTGE